MRRRGLTLAESIISIFILIAGLVVMARLLHSGLQYQASIDSQQLAVLLAERKLEEIRGWSKTTHAPRGATPFTSWSACPGASGPSPDPDFPAYTLTVTTAAQDVYSPCSLFELEFADPSERKCLSSSARRVQVEAGRDASSAWSRWSARPRASPELRRWWSTPPRPRA